MIPRSSREWLWRQNPDRPVVDVRSGENRVVVDARPKVRGHRALTGLERVRGEGRAGDVVDRDLEAARERVRRVDDVPTDGVPDPPFAAPGRSTCVSSPTSSAFVRSGQGGRKTELKGSPLAAGQAGAARFGADEAGTDLF